MLSQPLNPGAPNTGAYQPAGIISAAHDGHSSGVSWGAVLAGAAAAAALSFILIILGVGLGLSAVSPWSYNSGSAIGKSTIAWLALTQLAAAGIGGYIAGRLRVKWASVHNDEVYFRDTAHGLLAWSVATLVTAALLAGAVKSVLGGAVDTAGNMASGAASIAAPAAAAAGAKTGATADPAAYFSDVLLRSDQAATDTDNGATRAEVGRILVSDLANGALPADDKAYLANVIAKRTGITPAEASQRIDTTYARMTKAKADAETAVKQAADTARKAAAHTALWMFVALLLGAFIASLCATLGGKQRDRIYS